MTREKARLFIGSFTLTLILIGGLCGFILVDLSTDRYMPGAFSPIFLIEEIGPGGVGVFWMGNLYNIDLARLEQTEAFILDHRAFIPLPMRTAGALAREGMRFFSGLSSGDDYDIITSRFGAFAPAASPPFAFAKESML